MVLDLSAEQIFQPVQLSRRGEITAWVLALITFITLLFVWVRMGGLPLFSALIPGFFLLSAMSISLGNWMDRKTSIGLDADGVSFQNGLRKVRLSWDEIQEVSVHTHRFGDKVYLTGENTRFGFRMMGTVRLKGEVKGEMGFAEGEAILSSILERSGLQLSEDGSMSRYFRQG